MASITDRPRKRLTSTRRRAAVAAHRHQQARQPRPSLAKAVSSASKSSSGSDEATRLGWSSRRYRPPPWICRRFWRARSIAERMGVTSFIALSHHQIPPATSRDEASSSQVGSFTDSTRATSGTASGSNLRDSERRLGEPSHSPTASGPIPLCPASSAVCGRRPGPAAAPQPGRPACAQPTAPAPFAPERP
jgi:hypothetical protein